MSAHEDCSGAGAPRAVPNVTGLAIVAARGQKGTVAVAFCTRCDQIAVRVTLCTALE